ncbi:MAG: glycosyltransferase family 2 protein [Mycoplasma sp.]
MKDLTFVITTYKNKETIRPLIRILLKSNPQNVIFSDDCSPDDTKDFIQNIINNFNLNWKIISTPKNLDPMENRLNTLNHIKTKHFTFIDADDMINIEVLKEEISSIKLKNKHYKLWSTKVKDTYITNISRPFENKIDWLKNNSFQLHGVLWNTEMFKNISFNEITSIGEGYATLKPLIQNDFLFLETKEPIYYWVINKNSVSRTMNEKDVLKIFQNCFNIIKDFPDQEKKIVFDICFSRLLTYYILNPENLILVF